MSDPIVQLAGVTMRYDTADASVLDGIDLTIGRGESVAIVGESGCGKSTLLNLIGALDRPTGGSVTIGGQSLEGMKDDKRAALRSRDLGFIFQDHHLLPQCTVLENVLVPTLVPGSPNGADERARRLLDRVGLGDKLDARPGQLSGGQRQRVAVVRAIINEPLVLLADEPTGSLDRASSENLADLLCELNREDGLTLIVVTHAMPLAQRMQRVLTLRDGVLNDATES